MDGDLYCITSGGKEKILGAWIGQRDQQGQDRWTGWARTEDQQGQDRGPAGPAGPGQRDLQGQDRGPAGPGQRDQQGQDIGTSRARTEGLTGPESTDCSPTELAGWLVDWLTCRLAGFYFILPEQEVFFRCLV